MKQNRWFTATGLTRVSTNVTQHGVYSEDDVSDAGLLAMDPITAKGNYRKARILLNSGEEYHSQARYCLDRSIRLDRRVAHRLQIEQQLGIHLPDESTLLSGYKVERADFVGIFTKNVVAVSVDRSNQMVLLNFIDNNNQQKTIALRDMGYSVETNIPLTELDIVNIKHFLDNPDNKVAQKHGLYLPFALEATMQKLREYEHFDYDAATKTLLQGDYADKMTIGDLLDYAMHVSSKMQTGVAELATAELKKLSTPGAQNNVSNLPLKDILERVHNNSIQPAELVILRDAFTNTCAEITHKLNEYNGIRRVPPTAKSVSDALDTPISKMETISQILSDYLAVAQRVESHFTLEKLESSRVAGPAKLARSVITERTFTPLGTSVATREVVQQLHRDVADVADYKNKITSTNTSISTSGLGNVKANDMSDDSYVELYDDGSLTTRSS